MNRSAFEYLQENVDRNTLEYDDVIDFSLRFLEACEYMNDRSKVGIYSVGYIDGGCDTRGGLYRDYCTAVEFTEDGHCEFYRTEARARFHPDKGIEMIRVYPAESGAKFSSARGWGNLMGAEPKLANGGVQFQWVDYLYVT